MALLSTASDQEKADAQRMLASLSEGKAAPGPEAIKLYLSAQRSGDDQARQRLDLLRQQGLSIPFASAGDATFPDSGEIIPIGKVGEEMSPGYHCHFLRPGQMWCHGGID